MTADAEDVAVAAATARPANDCVSSAAAGTVADSVRNLRRESEARGEVGRGMPQWDRSNAKRQDEKLSDLGVLLVR